jgi:hypothetical protein
MARRRGWGSIAFEHSIDVENPPTHPLVSSSCSSSSSTSSSILFQMSRSDNIGRMLVCVRPSCVEEDACRRRVQQMYDDARSRPLKNNMYFTQLGVKEGVKAVKESSDDPQSKTSTIKCIPG